MDEKLRQKIIALIQSHVNSTNWADELADEILALCFPTERQVINCGQNSAQPTISPA